MSTPSCRVSLADLCAAGIRLNSSEAVTTTLDVIRRAMRAEWPGIPAAIGLRFSSDGVIHADGPVSEGASVERAGRLLDAMLPGFDAPSEHRVPGALRLVVARALRSLDLPPFGSLEEFSNAIARFGCDDPSVTVRSLCDRWTAAVGTANATTDAAPAAASEPDGTFDDLTISDVRRARRSTGLTLAEIADRSRIPVSLLRELEWGYFINWPPGHYGRIQLIRYARAAGLDEEIVIRAVWPVLQEAIRTRAAVHTVVAATVVDEDPSPAALVSVPAAAPVRRAVREALKPRPVLAIISIAALLAMAMLPGIWNSSAPAADLVLQRDLTRGDAARVPAELPPVVDHPAPEDPVQAAPVRAAARQPVSAGRGMQPALLQTDVGFSPAFATAGSAVFYHSASTGPSALMRADTDPSGAVLRVTSIVNDDAQNFHARPSPDGRFIAFDSDREGERAVYVADANGENVRRVTGEGFAAVPSWSPDGRRLAFIRAEADRPRVWNLWLLDLDSGRTTRVTSHTVGQPWGAAWFPDGKRIAYSHETSLIVRSLEDGTQSVYPSPRKGRLIRTPAVSPDGRRVMFQVHRDGAWLLDLSDASMIRVLTDPTAEEFTWSPTGDKVAYHSRRSGTWSVWVLAPR
jgi:Tol biopolymer transport system component